MSSTTATSSKMSTSKMNGTATSSKTAYDSKKSYDNGKKNNWVVVEHKKTNQNVYESITIKRNGGQPQTYF